MNDYIIKASRFVGRRFLKFLPDEPYLKMMFYVRMDKKLDLKSPKTFNEKLNWLKLHDRKKVYTVMADKLRAKEFVSNMIGEEYIVPVYAAWDSVNDINYDELPNKFVLKTNHDSGSVRICKDKVTFDKKAASNVLNKSMKHNYFYFAREWPYKNIERKIFAEKYLEMGDALVDYKVMCFNGEPRIIQVNYVSETRHTQDFYDVNWELTEISQEYYAPCSGCKSEKPKFFDLMIEKSRILAQNTYFLRVDWFEAEGKLYSGELTFFDGAGFDPYDDIKMDEYLGKLLVLPIDN